MGKGFWDFMSDFVKQDIFEYRKITKINSKETNTNKQKKLQLIRDGKTIVIDVDDYRLLDDEDDIPLLESKQ